MANKHYQKGYKFEAAVVEHLKSLGWEAKRAYASKGAFGEDVTAWVPGWEDGAIMYVQCKADGRKRKGKPVKQGMMQPREWNRFLGSVPPGNYVILANGTPAHIRFYEITGPRKEGLTGYLAKDDIERNMREFTPMDVHQWWDEKAREEAENE